jgi:16S rRNA (uracil1498-N3)-methyltransferase
MQVFVCDKVEDNIVFFGKEEAHHLDVLRLKKGDSIIVTDGNGLLANAVIIASGSAEIISVISNEERKYFLHLAVAPTKNIDRYEWFLEKATEIGIDCITPLICGRSERRTINEERLKKVITAAAKQSIKARFPMLNPAVKLMDFIKSPKEIQKMIAYCNTDLPLIKDIYNAPESLVVLIGPEGDFQGDEIDAAVQNKFTPISLGNYRLRTETAAIVTCNTIAVLNQLKT